MSDALQRWAFLVAAVNGRAIVGMPGVRDPEHPCDGFEPGTPDHRGRCNTDGHYMCDECVERATCEDCGLRPTHCAYWGCGARDDVTLCDPVEGRAVWSRVYRAHWYDEGELTRDDVSALLSLVGDWLAVLEAPTAERAVTMVRDLRRRARSER